MKRSLLLIEVHWIIFFSHQSLNHSIFALHSIRNHPSVLMNIKHPGTPLVSDTLSGAEPASGALSLNGPVHQRAGRSCKEGDGRDADVQLSCFLMEPQHLTWRARARQINAACRTHGASRPAPPMFHLCSSGKGRSSTSLEIVSAPRYIAQRDLLPSEDRGPRTAWGEGAAPPPPPPERTNAQISKAGSCGSDLPGALISIHISIPSFTLSREMYDQSPSPRE